MEALLVSLLKNMAEWQRQLAHSEGEAEVGQGKGGGREGRGRQGRGDMVE